MKSSEIRQMSRAEVEEQLADREEALSNLRLQLETRQLDNALLIRATRREVARLRTVLREDSLGIRPLLGEDAAGGTESQEES